MIIELQCYVSNVSVYTGVKWLNDDVLSLAHKITIVVASFPGCSHLQFLITCSIQKRRGEAWEKESRA